MLILELKTTTEVADFLDFKSNRPLRDALERAYSDSFDPAQLNPDSKANKFLNAVKFEGRPGAWAEASKNFVLLAEGDVRVLGPHADPTRVFAAVELLTIFETSGITGIDGIPMSELRELKNSAISDEDGLEKVSVHVQLEYTMYSGISD